ncbi:Histidine kinase-like ATPase domain-containing protein [Allopseudospirillum japonicum]|uniref:Histidine kinase-like ATPase domain-containing protein n=1 Tax=Allopseudospirillum japonicum TaxID=64971 RepID=A0A1H6S6P0_9GAMM|nr:fused response regulator/phosphatase [Allopseudospirillum japonicum]SEI60477.1 Histidine kinase-like ATPase domain-containing protein [Allopseudospirillum japonicum]
MQNITQLKVLLVDDDAFLQLFARRMLEGFGHEVITANNGCHCLEILQASEELPDVILMDVAMPEMDGIQATQQIRALYPAWLPVIFLSALEDTESIVRGFEAGGDDYMFKPLNKVILECKLKSVARQLITQRTLEQKNAQLETFLEQEEELRISSHIMQHVLKEGLLEDPWVSYHLQPNRHFSGDLLLVARTPTGALNLMLADAVGHGLSAAINGLPLVQIFSAMSQKGFALESIITEMNLRLRSLMPIDRFVAAALINIDPNYKRISVWNGGIPGVVMLTPQGETHHFTSNHLPLGLAGPKLFNPNTQSVRYQAPCQLFLCSDGLPDAENAHGEAFGEERVFNYLTQHAPYERMSVLQSELKTFVGYTAPHDDVTFVLVSIPEDDQQVIQSVEEHLLPSGKPELIYSDSSDNQHELWSFSLLFTAKEIKRLDLTPLVLNLVSEYAGRPINKSLFVVLSELINNSVDHGILGIDSRLKTSLDSFDTYLNTREQALEQLTDAKIDVNCTCFMQNQTTWLKIRVQDSGKGFNYQQLINTSVQDNLKLYGRGIPLICEMAEEVRYLGCGNEVEVVFSLDTTDKA